MKKKTRIWIYVLYGLPNAKSTAVFNPNKNYGFVKDIDGKVHKTL